MDGAPGGDLIWALAACSGSAPEAPPMTLEVASEKNVFASTEALGAYTMEATIAIEDTLPEVPPQRTTQTTSLRWKDEAHWAFVHTRDGRTLSETVVWDDVAWHADGDARLAKQGDAERWRVQLAQTWDPWSLAFESVRDQVRLEPGAVADYEGRRAVPNRIVHVPKGEKTRRAWVVEAASGEVWLDERTALRVKAEVDVRSTSGKHTRTTHLSMAVHDIGKEPIIAPPDGR